MKVPLLDLKGQYHSLKTEIDAAVQQVLESQMGVLGPLVQDFEEQVGKLISPARALGVSSGTDALLLGLMALDVGPGDEVIVPPFTFFATAAAVLRVGARPVFVDIEEDTFNIDPALIRGAITPKTKAIIPVHLFGQCTNMEEINTIAAEHGLRVIEDAAQALGATRHNKPACALGDVACVSFYPTKNLGACGEAGMVATRDPELFEKCRILRNQGMEPRYEHQYVGGNFRMDGFQGAVLGVKLRHLSRWNELRASHATRYNELLADSGLTRPVVAPGNSHIYHQYTIRVPDRDGLRRYLAERGVASEIYYPIPLHHQPCLAKFGYDRQDCPITLRAAGEVLSLPIYPELSDQQISYVADAICSFSVTAR